MSRAAKHAIVALIAWAGCCAASSVAAQGPEPLVLEDVLRSVREHHPQIAGSKARVTAAQARSQAARGGFDPLLKAESRVREGDGYDRSELNVELAQPTPAWGAELFAGYRLGRALDGDGWPSYDPDQTLDGGELRAGLRVPLYRGGPVDARRTQVVTAELHERAARYALSGTHLELRVQAVDAYLRWVAAGRSLAVTEQLLALAQRRAEQLERARAAGAVPDVDVIDNERMLFERQERMAAARRGLERAALTLSLYYRGPSGRPETPSPDRLPASFEPPPAPMLGGGAVAARIAACHPDLRELETAIEAAHAELRFADNQVAPSVIGTAQVSRDLGDAAERPAQAGTAIEVGVVLSMPLALRPERGERAARRAALAQKQAEISFARERLSVLVADVASRVTTAYDRHRAAVGQVKAAETLAEAERLRFRAGDSTLLFVNLREQSATDAELRRVEAALEAQLALFHWRQLQDLPCEAAF